MRSIAIILLVTSVFFVNAQKGLLWEVTKIGEDTSYIFGTIHSPAKRFVNIVPQLHVVKQKVSVGVFELILQRDSVEAFMLKQQKASFTAPETELTNDQARELFNLVSAQTGFDTLLLKTLHPVLMEIFLMQSFVSADTSAAVDALLQLDFTSKNKPILALESYYEQYNVMFKDSTIKHWRILYDLVKNIDRHKSEWRDLEKKYLNQDLTGLLALVEKADQDGFINNSLINNDRNIKMIKRLLPIISKQSALIAIGAAHLGGENGVLKLLTREGYKIRAILN